MNPAHSYGRDGERRMGGVKIVLDAMGGDNAPVVTVEGAVLAAREYGHEIILVGMEDAVRRELVKYDTQGLKITVCNATETIKMDDQPAQAVFRFLEHD